MFSASRNLRETDPHRLLIQRGIFAHSPAQVDVLEPAASLLGERPQPGKDLLLKPIPLCDHIAERGADENTKSFSLWLQRGESFRLGLPRVVRAAAYRVFCNS